MKSTGGPMATRQGGPAFLWSQTAPNHIMCCEQAPFCTLSDASRQGIVAEGQ